MTRWVGRLIGANIFMFLLQQAYPGFTGWGMFVPAWVLAEARIGGRNVLALYFASGLGGALLCFIQPAQAVIGASGAIFGVSLAYARYWPYDRLLLFFVIPMTTRTMVTVYAIISVIGAVSPVPLPLFGNVAHLGHLGGFAGGWLFLTWMERTAGGRSFRQRAETGWTVERKATAPVPKVIVELATGEKETLERWARIKVDQLHPVNREEYERIGAKLAAAGLRSLTPLEREFMERFAALAT